MKLLTEYLALLDKMIAERTAALARGNAHDFAEYRHNCGVISGLQLAAKTLIDYVKEKPLEERA